MAGHTAAAFAAPEAQPDDGWLDVYVVRTAGRLTIAKLLGMYKMAVTLWMVS